MLGSLSPEDRRAFEEHLRTCDSCRAAVTELAGLPGLLRMVPADEARGLGSTPDAEVVELATLARAAHRSRRRRRTALVGVAAALLLLGGVAGVLLGRPLGTGTRRRRPRPPRRSRPLRLEPVGAVDVTADLTCRRRRGARGSTGSAGTGASWPAGTGPTYELVLVDSQGESTVVATWLGRDVGARTSGASSSIATDTIRRVEIRVAGSDAALAAAQT